MHKSEEESYLTEVSFVLIIAPLVASLSAGNCALLKPSHNSPNTSEVSRQIIEHTLELGGKSPCIVTAEADLKTARRVIETTFSGGACINVVLLHIANRNLPFGGVGESGIQYV